MLNHHVNIGLFGETLVGSQMALVTEVTRRDLPTLAMGIITLSIGAFVLFLFVVRRKERGYLTYGLLALTMGAYFAAAPPSRQLIADAPLFWLHAELFSLYLLGGSNSPATFLRRIKAMGQMKRLQDRLVVTIVLAVVPFVMAPTKPPCPLCAWLEKFDGALPTNESVRYSATVEANVRYAVHLLPSASDVELLIDNGDIEDVECATSGNEGFCCYTATNAGKIDYKVMTGSKAATFELYHLKCTD